MLLKMLVVIVLSISMWAAKITALPFLGDHRALEGLKPNQSYPKALTSYRQCHLFQTVTGVNLAVLAKSDLRLLERGYLQPSLCCSLPVPARVERAVQQLL